MGLFDFLKKKKKISAEDQAVIDNSKASVDILLSAPSPISMAQEEYLEMRQAERDWLERHYDFSTVESVNAIPERKDLPRPPGNSSTGEIYYYLRYKARLFEQAGDIELALACMRKSISLMRIRYGEWYGYKESKTLVYMLARNGQMEEAKAENIKIDAHYTGSMDRMRLENFRSVCKIAAELETDLLFMQVLGSTCPECAKYQGRVYSISGTSKLFPPLPEIVKKTGAIHPGCHHTFTAYTHTVTHIDMAHIMKVHPLKNPRLGKNIITFSNRPFVDDRTEDCKRSAEIAQEKRRANSLNKYRRNELILENYQRQQNDYADYEWLKAHFPDKCPSSPTGYRRMKTQNTKNYQILKQLAAQQGKEI